MENQKQLVQILGEVSSACSEACIEHAWETFYAENLIQRSDFKELLKRLPTQAELTELLKTLDYTYKEQEIEEGWREYYARRILEKYG